MSVARLHLRDVRKRGLIGFTSIRITSPITKKGHSLTLPVGDLYQKILDLAGVDRLRVNKYVEIDEMTYKKIIKRLTDEGYNV